MNQVLLLFSDECFDMLNLINCELFDILIDYFLFFFFLFFFR